MHSLDAVLGSRVMRIRAKAAFLADAMAAVIREIKRGGLDYRAMSLVYTSLLALVPLLAVSFSVMKAVGGESHLEPLLRELLGPLGENAEPAAVRILDSVKRLRVGLLGFLGLAFLFYTSIALLEKIEESFNHIWRAKASRSLLRRLSDYLSFTLVGPLLLFSAFGGVAGLIRNRRHSPVFGGLLEPIQPLIQSLLPYLFIIAAFTFVYSCVPNCRVKIQSALFGGVVAGLAWKYAGWLFSAFVAGSAQYHAVYSSFAILILFMIWLYVSWLIVLLGVQVSFFHQHPRYLRSQRPDIRLGPRSFETAGLTLLWLVGRRFFLGEPAWNTETLAQKLGLPDDCIDELLSVLREAGLLMSVDSGRGAFAPSRDLAAISLREVLDALRGAHGISVITDDEAMHIEAVEAFCSGLESAVRQHAGATTLRDLVSLTWPTADGEVSELS